VRRPATFITTSRPAVWLAGLAVAFTLLTTCDDEVPSTAPEVGSPVFAISDAVHNDGNEHFFWLPPLVDNPRSFNGDFDGSLSPVVRIWDVTEGAEILVAEFTTTTGPGSETVRATTEDLYIVNWHTDQFELSETATYRITVLVAEIPLGFVDVKVRGRARAAKNASAGEYVALKHGRTLPIKFRIEHGAVFVVTGRVAAPQGYPVGGLVAEARLGDYHATSAIGASGTFQLGLARSAGLDSVRVTIDAEPGALRRFHPSLLFLPADQDPGPITVLLAPLRWTVDGGIYDGEEVEVSLNEVYTARSGTAWDRFWGESSVFQQWPQLWDVAPDFPIPVVFARDSSDAAITAADSVIFWSEVEVVNEQLGEDVFVPASYLGIGARDAEIYVWVDETISAAGTSGRIGGRADYTARVHILLYGKVQFRASLETLASSVTPEYLSLVVRHEMVHRLGAGHSCTWAGLMSYCHPISPDLSAKDVAVIQLITTMARLQMSLGTPFGIGEAIQGERSEVLGMSFLPCPWVDGVDPGFGNQGQIRCEPTP